MRLVVDTNVVFSGLIAGGKTRELILSDRFDLHTPEYFATEVRNHREMLREKTGLSTDQLDTLLDLLLGEITTIPSAAFSASLPTAREEMADIDPDDAPFLALAIHLNCPL
ncbi:MAG TPA: PIN domain-containing protein [Halococcus sp.]|nr:PIN domain-containing protein [Halococcus sp.]